MSANLGRDMFIAAYHMTPTFVVFPPALPSACCCCVPCGDMAEYKIKNGAIFHKCYACGAKDMVDMSHKVRTKTHGGSGGGGGVVLLVVRSFGWYWRKWHFGPSVSHRWGCCRSGAARAAPTVAFLFFVLLL